MKEVLTATVSNEIFLPIEQVDEQLLSFIKKNLAFTNPRLGELLRLGYSIWRVPKKIICYRQTKKGYYLPIGFGASLRQFINHRSQELKIIDKRCLKEITPVMSKISLHPEQQVIIEQVMPQYRCIVEAKPGFGKTMLGIEVLCRRSQKTLIIVHTRTLLRQWQKRLSDYGVFQADGLGVIGEGKWQLGSQVTIAMYQTLLSRGTKSLANEFGLLIVDECHHVPAKTFSKIVKSMSAKYCLGLSATPYRKDKLDKLLTLYLGKIISTSTIESSLEQSLLPKATIPTTVYYRQTGILLPHWQESEFAQLGTLLASSKKRQALIMRDIAKCLQKQAKVLVLSERVKQAEDFYQQMTKLFPQLNIALITGQQDLATRQELLSSVKANRYHALVATGGVVGEGFDWPETTHLFLTFPFSWRGKLIQYVGRTQRQAKGKTQAFVFDYLDEQMSIFASMWGKRLRAYRALGLKIQALD